MKRYLLWVLLSTGLHGGLLWGLHTGFQTAELPLQVGQASVDVQFVNSMKSPSNPEPANHRAIEDLASDDVKPAVTQSTEADLNHGQPIVSEHSNEPVQKIDRAHTPAPDEAPEESTLAVFDIPKNPEFTFQPPSPEANEAENNMLFQHQQLASTAQVTSVSDGVIHAKLQSSSKPRYPKPAIIRNQQGKVIVRLLVDQNGTAQHTALLHSSGHELLDRSVLRFVEQEKFVPATLHGSAIESTQEFSFRFVLQ